MSYKYSEAIGLLPSDYRPAGQVAVYDHVIKRLREKMPSVVYQFGGGQEYTQNVNITYAFEYPEKLLDLPFVVLTFISEFSRSVGLGQVAGGVSFGELSGMYKDMVLQIDVWARNSMERDLISDAITYVMQISRNYFCALGFRDIRPELSQTRMFEQTRDTIYPRVAQTTTRVWRKVVTYNVEYDLVWEPPKDVPSGIIEQIDVNGSIGEADYELRVGYATDLIIDSKHPLKRPLGRFVPW
jgi:hypothetical protein